MKSLLLGFLGGFIGVFMALVVVSQYADYRAESELSGWLSEVEPAQAAVAANGLRQGTLEGAGIGTTLPPIHYRPPAYYRIDANGQIFMRGGDEGQFVVLVPTLANGAVTWQCVGGSKDSVSMWCDDPALPSHPTPGSRR
jgi:hypothetical protein